MSDCKYQQFLGAYHDGELDSRTHEDVHQHVQTCCLCREQLAHVRKLSNLIRTVDLEKTTTDIQPEELRRVHSAVRRVQHNQPLLRIAGYMSAVAASILIISAAWLMELPHGQTPQRSDRVAVINTPDWERIASIDYTPATSVYDPMPVGAPTYALADGADAEIVSLMIHGLSK
jgi:predicted anti-sigma-YlaC factor YlaD